MRRPSPLISIYQRYQVIASKALTAYDNLAGHLLTLHDRPIFQAVESALWPDRDALRGIVSSACGTEWRVCFTLER